MVSGFGLLINSYSNFVNKTGIKKPEALLIFIKTLYAFYPQNIIKCASGIIFFKRLIISLKML